MKGTELLELFEAKTKKLSWYQISKCKKIERRIERLKILGLNKDYWEHNGVYTKCETFDPDISVRNRIKSKEITEGNDCISGCLNCKLGAIFEIDPIEKIGQCNVCFTEFKLL